MTSSDSTSPVRVLPRALLLLAVCALALSTCGPVLSAGQGEGSGAAEEGPLSSTHEPVVSAAETLEPALPGPTPSAAATALPSATPDANADVKFGQVLEAVGGAEPPAAPQESGLNTAAVDLPPVKVQQPKIRLEGPAQTDASRVGEALGVDGVEFASSLIVGEVPISSEAGDVSVSFAAVDVSSFRILTPQITADAVEVWQRVAEGDAAFTHDAGNRLELELGSRVPAGEADETLRVGAYASNGVPPVADAILSKDTASELGLGGVETLLVSVDDGADPAAVAQALSAATGLEAEVLADPETQRAFLTGADARNSFEPFSYIDNGDGMIQIDPAWVESHIVSAEVPIFRGHVVCHRLLIPQLRGALQEVADAGLAHLIDPSQYGGCWVPRHIDFNPSRPISMHAWGLAVDFNVSTNGLGETPQMDMRIVEIFDRWGFVWGGRWSRPDGMHFELGAVLESPEG